MGNKRPNISIVGNRCCGCGACTAICPKECLTMTADKYGFVQPIYGHGCIGCGRCASACPVLTAGDSDLVKGSQWAKAKSGKLRERSSSGGVFGLLAQHVLDCGGVVYGAAFDDGCRRVKHTRIDDIHNLDIVLRSKYVQSTIGPEIYHSVESELRSGKEVLFSGVSCQCAAMRNYLLANKIPVERLLLVEVICHGIPSPKLWKAWLDWISQNAGVEVDSVNFRSKSTGWLTYSVEYYGSNEKVKGAINPDDWYFTAFQRNASLRSSCFECPAKRRSGSDITLGDYWGVEHEHPEALDSLGVSAVICNTEKGVRSLRTIEQELEMGPSSFDEIASGNAALIRSSAPYEKRDEFLADVADGAAIDELMSKWSFKITIWQRLKHKMSRLNSMSSEKHMY